MKVLISHPTGNQNVRAAAIGFAEAGMATSFNTTIAVFEGDLINHLGNLKPFSILSRRRFDSRIKNITETWPWLEIGRMIALKAGLRSLTRHEHGMFSIDAVYRNLDKRVSRLLPQRSKCGMMALYAYEDGAHDSFRNAKRLGLRCFYDLPLGYWRAGQRILEAEKERWPEWSPTLTGLHNSAEKLARKDEELQLADRIYVASQFTAKTLEYFPGCLPPVEVIPYGFPDVVEARDYSAVAGNRPLKLLYVGGLTQRKGIANLFKATAALKRYVQLTVVGNKPVNSCPALEEELKKHHWIQSLPNREVLKMMREHDVLVFPSLFEGFGLVITEAMSQGTPVITTNRTAGPDLIEHGRNGWIIEAGCTEALKNAIENILQDRKIIPELGRAAMETAKQRSWNVYGRELATSVLKQMEVRNIQAVSHELSFTEHP